MIVIRVYVKYKLFILPIISTFENICFLGSSSSGKFKKILKYKINKLILNFFS